MDLHGSGRNVIEVLSRHFLGRTEENYDSCVLAEIRTEHFLNGNQDRYSYASSLDISHRVIQLHNELMSKVRFCIKPEKMTDFN
jgi:hypothetical protein